jgi:hypothetical protein
LKLDGEEKDIVIHKREISWWWRGYQISWFTSSSLRVYHGRCK